MTVNPMQRRTRNSFLLGFGVAVLVAAVVVAGLFVLLRNANAKLKEEKIKQRELLVASVDINEYSEVNLTNTILENTIVSVGSEEIATATDLTPEGKKILSKTRIPKGTVITTSMLISEEEKDSHDLRLYELNMVMIPSELKDQDVIDIRLLLPTGEDFIVISKKSVEKADAQSIWIRMTEDEILVFNNAMVESYLVEGSKLYAATYVNPGIQKAAAQTYPLSGEAWDLIKADSNVTVKAREALIDKHNKTAGVRKTITEAKTKAMQENGLDRVYDAINKEITEMNKKREEYIDQLVQIDY